MTHFDDFVYAPASSDVKPLTMSENRTGFMYNPRPRPRPANSFQDVLPPISTGDYGSSSTAMPNSGETESISSICHLHPPRQEQDHSDNSSILVFSFSPPHATLYPDDELVQLQATRSSMGSRSNFYSVPMN